MGTIVIRTNVACANDSGNSESILSIDHRPQERKDMQLIIDFDYFDFFNYFIFIFIISILF